MPKSSFTVLLLLVDLINFGNIFVIGQSTVGSYKNDEEDKVSGLSGFLMDLRMDNSEASVALTKSIQSEFQNLKAEIARLKDHVERHDTYMNYSTQELKRQMQMESMTTRNEFQAQCQTLPRSRCPNGFNYTATAFPKCYAVLRQAAKWDAAQQKCRQLDKNAHLAVINGALEQQIISHVLKNYDCPQINYDGGRGERPGNYFWVGGQLRNVTSCNSTYAWKPDNRTSLPIGYSNWFSGEPNCASIGLMKNCIGIRNDGQWNDLPCSWNFCSVCEVTVYI